MSEGSNVNKNLKGRLILPALLVGTFLTLTVTIFASTLVVDIAKTFRVSIGTLTLLGLIGAFVGLFFGIAMGALTLRFRHKLLYILGAVLYGFGSLIYFFAPNITTVLLATFFLATGGSMVGILAISLIGDLFPMNKRGWAIGVVMSALLAAYVVMPFLSGLIGQIEGWRDVLLLFIFPTSVFCAILGLLAIPSKSVQDNLPGKPRYLEVFKKVLLNKSALACQVGNMLRICLALVPLYAIAFYRIVFLQNVFSGGVIGTIASLAPFSGTLVGGRLVNRVGRKPMAVVPPIISGVFAIAFTFVPGMVFSLALLLVQGFFGGLMLSGLFNLALEQVPSFRSSMMSIANSFQNLGTILGIVIGGAILSTLHPNAGNFQLLMTVLGVGGIASGLVLLLAKDPCKTQKSG